MSEAKSDCCSPGRSGRAQGNASIVAKSVPGRPVPHDDVLLAGGHFHMGDHFGEGHQSDGETPVHGVRLDPFRIDRACVTNAQFAAFTAATDYVTEAEQFGNSAVFAPMAAAERSDVIGYFGTRWWLAVRGADWRHPFGPLSGIAGADHPVVHVSHNDAQAYCAWAGRSLPTEAEWEFAARGGSAGRRYPWGNELEAGGTHHANVWQGQFPDHNTAEDGWLATAPVRSYPANDFGLFQIIGNVWEWCGDWFDAGYYSRAPLRNPAGPESGTARVIRGGSYLCHDSYCRRYRVAARNANTPESTTCNMGFRTVLRVPGQQMRSGRQER